MPCALERCTEGKGNLPYPLWAPQWAFWKMLNEAYGASLEWQYIQAASFGFFLLHPWSRERAGLISLSPTPSSKQTPSTTAPSPPGRQQISRGSFPQVSLKIALRGRESGFGKCDLSSQLRRNVHNKLLSGLNCSVKWQSLPRRTGPGGPAILHLLITVAMEKATISLEKAP